MHRFSGKRACHLARVLGSVQWESRVHAVYSRLSTGWCDHTPCRPWDCSWEERSCAHPYHGKHLGLLMKGDTNPIWLSPLPSCETHALLSLLLCVHGCMGV